MFGLLVGAVAFLVDFQLVSSISNQVFGGIMLVISLIATITALVFARRRRTQLITLEDDIVTMRTTLKDLKQEALRQKKLFFPTQQTFKEVREDYKVLKQSF